MRNGILIRGLGRRSFEPIPGTDPSNTPPQSQQQTPIPLEPTSTNINAVTPSSEDNPFSHPPTAHQLNTAQNEVLRKVSDLLKGKSGKVLDHEELVWENEIGLIVSAVDMAVNYLIFWPLVAIRNRIQTFTAFGGKRLRNIFYNAIFVEGPRGLYTGMTAHLAFQIVGIAKELAKDRALRYLDDRGFFDDRKRRTWFRRLSTGVDWLFWVTTLYPMYRYSLLQANLLLPATPIIPNPFSLPSTSLLSTFTPPTSTTFFSLGTARHIFSRLTHSSLLWVALNRQSVTKIRSETFRVLMTLLPKPSNPDSASLKATREFEGDDPDLYSSDLRRRRRRPQGTSHNDDFDSDSSSSHHEADTTNIILSDIDSGQQYTVSVPPPDTPFTQFPTEDYVSDDEFLTAAFQEEAIRYTESLFDPTTGLPTPLAPLGQTSGLPPPNLPGVEVIEPATAQPVPAIPVAPSTTRRKHKKQRRNGPHHRVTTLSQHPADAAANQAGDAVANFACLFLESAALRCLALEFLPPSEHGAVIERFSISGNTVLILKSLMVEWAVSWVAFQITLGVTKGVGKRLFGYPDKAPEVKREGVTLTDPGLAGW